jgi:hypothetical protein
MGFGKVPGHLIPLLHPSSKVPLYLPPNDESPRIAEAFEDAPGEIRTPDPLIRSQLRTGISRDFEPVFAMPLTLNP